MQDGERNRALTIVKSRGTGHSNQVRELTLSDEGVTLTDVFVAQGKVLMGVARWEWEQEEQAAKSATQVASELKRLQLQLAQAEAGARLQVVQTEMEARNAEIAVLAMPPVRVQAARHRSRRAAQDAPRRRRGRASKARAAGQGAPTNAQEEGPLAWPELPQRADSSSVSTSLATAPTRCAR